MKIIEGMKKVKMLSKKAEDLRGKIAAHSADLDFETPLYTDQRTMITGWLQAHFDIMKEVSDIRVSIQRTNLATQVSMSLGDNTVTKSIAEWVHRRRDLAGFDLAAWQCLTDKNLREGTVQQSTGQLKEVRIRRYFDPIERDRNIDLYRNEPFIIDSTLEVANAVTELI